MKLRLAVMGMLCGFLISCGKPYVGWKVNYDWDGLCTYAEYQDNGKKRCMIDHGALLFDFTIKKGENDNGY